MAKLHFHYGVMNSGKSAQLLMTANTYKISNIPVEIIKPVGDTRSVTVKSRAMKDEAVATTLPSFENYQPAGDTRILMIDEIQFFKPSDIDILVRLAETRTEALKMKNPDWEFIIMCYGLMVDSNEKLFPTSARLVEVGAKLHRVRSPCQIEGCAKLATHNLRFDAAGNVVRDGAQVCVGDSNYKSVCRRHFYQLYHGFGLDEKGSR